MELDALSGRILTRGRLARMARHLLACRHVRCRRWLCEWHENANLRPYLARAAGA